MFLETFTLFFGYFAVFAGAWGLIRPDHFKFLMQWRIFSKVRFILFFVILSIGWAVLTKIWGYEGFRIKVAGLIIVVVLIKAMFLVQKKTLESALKRFSSWPLPVFRILSLINLLLGIYLIKR